jgi:AraC-like DNA-binding protein
MSVTYREFAPSPALRPYVDRLWLLEGPAAAIESGPIPPDGRTEIIVHAGDPFARRDEDGRLRLQERVLIAGQATRALELAPRGHARLVGARLRPAGAHALLRVPQHELADAVVPLAELSRRLARRLADDVANRQETDGMADALARALAGAAASAPATPSPAARAVDRALARRGLVRVDDLATSAGISRRQLERVFLDHVGLPPKLFLRIIRFQEALGALRDRPPRPDWARVAVEHGFYDQAHFIRDFRAFAGATPGALPITDESLTAIFSSIRRT